MTFFIVCVHIFDMECLRLHSCDLCERDKYCKDDKESHKQTLVNFRINSIKKAMFIVGTRPGLGTSLYAAQHAYSLSNQGYKVALLETSNLFPSLQIYFNLENFDKLKLTINGIIPVKPIDNISFMSTSLFMNSENDKLLLWDEAAMLTFIENMIVNTNWGDIDYFIIDIDSNHINLLNKLQLFFKNKLEHSIVITNMFIYNHKQSKLFFSYINDNTKILYVLNSFNSYYTNLNLHNFKCSEIPYLQNIGELISSKSDFISKTSDFYSDITKEVTNYCSQVF